MYRFASSLVSKTRFARNSTRQIGTRLSWSRRYVPTKLECGAGSSEVVRSTREMQPAHYTFKIDSFSLLSNLLSKSEVQKYESDTFEAGGYKWKLSLYPSGRKERNANGYISLYLGMVETDTLPLGWEINVKFNIFVYDQIRDEYLTFQDGNGGVVRFHGMKTEHGFPQLLPLVNFNNASNGYLVDDSCIFGAEIFVIKSTGNGECVSILETGDDFHSWELKKFSTLNTERCWSEEFKSGEHKWKLMVYPKGVSSQRGEYLCLGIKRLADTSLPPGKQLFAEYRLRIRDQIHGQHHEKTGQLALFLRFTVPSYYSLAHHIINLNSKTTSFEQHFAFKSSKDAALFSTSTFISWKYIKFLSLSAIHDTSKGFLVNDTLIVEGQIKVLSAVKRFS